MSSIQLRVVQIGSCRTSNIWWYLLWVWSGVCPLKLKELCGYFMWTKGCLHSLLQRKLHLGFFWSKAMNAIKHWQRLHKQTGFKKRWTSMWSLKFCILQAFTQMAQMKSNSEQSDCRVKIYHNYQKVLVNKIINQLWSICQCKKWLSAFSYTLLCNLITFYNQRWCPLLASRKNGRLKHFQQHIFKLTRLHPSFLYSLWSKITPLSALHQLYTVLFVWPNLE